MKNNLKHVAIIMDGNGRWAQERSRPRFWGHVRGAYRVSDIVERASDLGIESLTLYAFSTENWSRPADEIKVLFRLLHKYLNSEFNRIIDNNIKFRVIGETKKLGEETLEIIHSLEDKTKQNTGLNLTFCFGYSGRFEILSAVNAALADGAKEVDEQSFSKYFFRPECGDVDLLIRTGGDKRISNFLLWQIAYAELYFEDTKWPEFTANKFENIIDKFSNRSRRFGGIENTVLSFSEARKNMNNIEILNS
jgi:undecaprenyl diphosphate synthase